MDNNRKLVHLNETNNKDNRKQKIALLKSVAAGGTLTKENIENIYGKQPDLILQDSDLPEVPTDELHKYLDNQSIEERQRMATMKMEHQPDGRWFIWYE